MQLKSGVKMNKKSKKGLFSILILVAITASANDIDYVLEASLPAYSYHKTSYANTDGSKSQNQVSDVVAKALLSPAYEDQNPLSLSLLINSASIHPVRLEIGGEYIVADNIKYEANFIGRAVFQVSDSTSVFFGGKFGVGESKVENSSITFTGAKILGGTASIEIPLPRESKYSVAGGQVGFIYAVSKNIEVVVLGEITGKTADLSENIDKGAVATSAGASGMNPIAILDALEAIGPQTILSWSANAGLRIRF